MINIKTIQKLTVAFMVSLAVLVSYVPTASAWTKNDTSQEQLKRYASHVLYGVWTDGETSSTLASSDTPITYVFYVTPDLKAYFEVRDANDGTGYLFRTYRDDDNHLCAEVTNQSTQEKVYLVKTDG